MKFVCQHCFKIAERLAGDVNRAMRADKPLYCNRTCAGIARQVFRTNSEKTKAKQLYDIGRRERDRDKLKAQKAAHYRSIREERKVRDKAYREDNMKRHVEYCRRPEYVKYKREYDRQYRAREYGDYAEAFILLQDLDKEINSRISDYDTRTLNGTLGKRQQRKRDYERTLSN